MTDKIKIDRVLQSAIGPVPGVVALATTRGGTIYEGAFGRRDVSADAPMTLDTMFWLASMTKALASTAALQQVEQGKLSLDAPIEKIIPELAAPQVLDGFSDAGAAKLRPAARPITLRRLLCHSAGFGYTGLSADLGRYFELNGLARLPTSYDELARVPLLFDPGTRWEYGINTDVAGKAVERASGQRLDAYFAEHLFGPLGMGDTTVTLTAEQRGRMARLHTRLPDGSLVPIDHAAGGGPAFSMGGGAFCGTGADYLRFTRMILNGGMHDGARILAPTTIEGMSENQLGAASVTKMRSVDMATSNEVEFFPGIDKKWSTAFMINTARAPTGRSAGSLAWAGVANTYFWIDPTAGVAGVMLTQMLPFADAAVLDLFGAFERAVYDVIGA